MPGSARALEIDTLRDPLDSFEFGMRHMLARDNPNDQEDLAALVRQLVTALDRQAKEGAGEEFGRHRQGLSRRINLAWFGVLVTILTFAGTVGMAFNRISNLESQMGALQANSQTLTEVKVRTEGMQRTVDRIQEILDNPQKHR